MAFFAQQDHRQMFHFVVDCLDFVHLFFLLFFGIGDQHCWLAEAWQNSFCMSFCLISQAFQGLLTRLIDP